MIKELQYTLKFYKGKYIILFFVIFLNVVKMAISLVTPLLYSDVIDDCNLDFYNGIIGIKGQNGCGKTTLLKLILNEYEVQKGNIYLNELNIKDIQYLSLQERISYVGADKHVYSLSVRDTLLLFSDKNNIAEKKVKA